MKNCLFLSNQITNSRMRKKSVLSAAVAVCICLVSCETQPKEIPLVYDSESTYTLTDPYLPSYEDLPSVKTLTDPFACSDGSGCPIRFALWARRRAETGAEIQRYEVGTKPGKDRKSTRLNSSHE